MSKRRNRTKRPKSSPVLPDPVVQVQTARPGSRTSHGVQLEDLIARGLLRSGDTLVHDGRDGRARARMVGARIEYGGVLYDAPTPACVAANGGKSRNGWEYWKLHVPGTVRDGRTLGQIRADHPLDPGR